MTLGVSTRILTIFRAKLDDRYVSFEFSLPLQARQFWEPGLNFGIERGGAYVYVYPPYRVRKNFRAGAKGARLYSLRIAQPSSFCSIAQNLPPL